MASGKRTDGISVRHALTDTELKFVRVFSAFGEADASEAYRRSHLVQDAEGDWYRPLESGKPDLNKPMGAPAVGKAARLLLRRPHIQQYLEELRQSAGDHARQTLRDAVLFTDDSTALKAAEKVLADEDKLGFRDAAELHAEILCAIGAEVDIYISADQKITVPLKAMFPQYAEALPPKDVIEKTIRTLEEYRDAAAARAAESE